MTFSKHGGTGANIYIMMLVVAMMLPIIRVYSDLGVLPGLILLASLASGAWFNARSIIRNGASGKGEALGLLSGLLAWLTCWGAPKIWVIAGGNPDNKDVTCLVSVVVVSILAGLAWRGLALLLDPPGQRT